METIIKVENLSKIYQLGQYGTGTLSLDLERWWALIRGKEDPFIKIGERNNRLIKGDNNIVKSLNDLNFQISKGDAVGIIGRNGAGKSTLLKILSRVTTPTKGSVKIKGRVASLLEVGTGFHPELTGRENIYLNGAILGMRKSEIDKNLDEIINFSGVERYIDTPVKRYSSGMYVRLAFAVAAHLESEVLIVDEVLAVGDIEFQKKCLTKMNNISKSDGRTILFVSHNLQSISNLCNKAIVLSNGEIVNNSSVSDAIDFYQKSLGNENNTIERSRIGGSGLVKIKTIKIADNKSVLNYNKDLSFEIEVESNSNEIIEDVGLWFGLFDFKNNIVCNSLSINRINLNSKSISRFNLVMPANRNLMPGDYQVGLNLAFNIKGNNYESLDMINGFPIVKIILGDIDNKNDLSFSSFWPQEWGSIVLENRIIPIKL